MKVKSWPIIMKTFAIISLVLTFSLVSCTKSTEEEDELSIFDARASGILTSSLIDLPLSLLMGSEGPPSDNSMKNIAVKVKEFGDNDNVDLTTLNFWKLDNAIAPFAQETRNYGALYDVARNYVSVAAEIKSKIKMFITDFIGNLGALKDVDLPLELPNYVLGDDVPFHKVLIEVPETEEYTWKIGLYYTESSLKPETVFFLSISEEGGKGRMFMKMENEKDEYAAAVGIDLTLTKKVEAVFDGTRNPKTFEIKYIGDRTEARNYAENNWTEFPDNATGAAIKDALTKIPEKIFLTVKYHPEDEEWDVYGASYHPGWKLLEQLDGKAFWNDPSRTIYSFKAKSVKSEGGAKLALALPQDTSENPDVWGTDPISSVFVDMVLTQLNNTIRRLGDDVNDYPPTYENPYYDPPNTPPLYAGSAENEKYKATAMYDCIMRNCEVKDNSDSLPPDPKVTQANMEKFVNLPPVTTDLFNKVQALHSQCRVISYMVNPVFFRSEAGLVATYNAKTEQFYQYTYRTGNFGAGTTDVPLISGLMDISLDNIGSYTPAYIKTADIKAE